jgi:hypothetical protein
MRCGTRDGRALSRRRRLDPRLIDDLQMLVELSPLRRACFIPAAPIASVALMSEDRPRRNDGPARPARWIAAHLANEPRRYGVRPPRRGFGH